jgi:hypothetical protein
LPIHSHISTKVLAFTFGLSEKSNAILFRSTPKKPLLANEPKLLYQDILRVTNQKLKNSQVKKPKSTAFLTKSFEKHYRPHIRRTSDHGGKVCLTKAELEFMEQLAGYLDKNGEIDQLQRPTPGKQIRHQHKEISHPFCKTRFPEDRKNE